MSPAHDANAGANSWGVLINPDKSPAPLLEQLCLGIAQVMINFDEYATTDLTPDRMAAFYRKVGGNYDLLFLDTKPSALSFIYQRLGCFHSIQPSNDPFKPPSIPALQPNGFVRWQTIQLLLDPDEHAQYLQNAVSLWNIELPNGTACPKLLPRDAFPSEPDPEMVEWHEGVSRRFEFDYWKKNVLKASPPNFRTYHTVFSQKDAPAAQEEPPRDHHTAHPRRSVDTDDGQRKSQQSRRRSTEYRPSATRRVKSTYFPRPEDEPDFVSPEAFEAPSPPRRTSKSTKSRGRERPKSFVYPSSLGAALGHETSDASSEDSGTPPQTTTEPTAPTAPSPPDRHSHRRNLSPPRSYARRHSHEAYARRPKRDGSPDSPRRHTHRDIHAPSTRLYDSDGARKPRPAQSRLHANEPLPACRPGGVRFREHIFHDPQQQPHPQAEPSMPDSPVYAHVHTRYVNGVPDPYLRHPDYEYDYVVDEPRRASTSYRDTAHAHARTHSQAQVQAHVYPVERDRERERTRSYSGRTRAGWASPPPGKRGVSVVDMEYPAPVAGSGSGRRATMYER
ncbi:uncharacterized protein ACLA_065850 [Aspergillus clavatus NRRL 1]|uniref:DUF7514 domain-containing protein n=1 Tax=Aspergillus clavatus (strain ATCC 1007 / CBS 513.65 / DSM 816 / NCTC 3887 / NRRL 1 / QM 1276 / 107) TaxID=344612 RepID=A1CG71_ASPCL|nr:uncharacterized protein ACLA_065850 [Aspergillus clavatus NRRL 1]EAW10951.1 conserved hypothetical protein [Aspergillus clavatus NRRL 1]